MTQGLRVRSPVLAASALLLMLGCLGDPRVHPATGISPSPALDPLRLLPPPPAPGSREARSDLEQVLSAVAARTPRREALAQADAELSMLRLLPEDPGPSLQPAQVPALMALSDRLRDEVLATTDVAKNAYARPRPFVVDPEIAPCIAPPGTPAYPSGHAAFAAAGASLLADMAPERRAEFFRRASEYAWSRVVCGLHFPSDVRAGETLGRAIAAQLLASPGFRESLAPARAELHSALALAVRRRPGLQRSPVDRRRAPHAAAKPNATSAAADGSGTETSPVKPRLLKSTSPLLPERTAFTKRTFEGKARAVSSAKIGLLPPPPRAGITSSNWPTWVMEASKKVKSMSSTSSLSPK